jgi:hypothetical protein
VIRFERDASGDLWAIAEVAVGAGRSVFEVPLGVWGKDDPPSDGLAQTPVVVLPEGAWTGVVAEAARVAGDAEALEVSPDGRSLLGATADVLVIPHANGRTMNVIRALGGRPLPALPLTDPVRVAAFLDGCHVDLDIALPGLDGPRRAELRAATHTLGLDDVHHLVEVDPRPGLASEGIDPDDAPLDALAAAAAGVLAGRLAAARRRYRAERS